MTKPIVMPDAGDPRRCKAIRYETGEQCKNWSIKGGAVCVSHGGTAPQVRAAANRRLAAEKAMTAVTRLGVSIETTPIEALEQMLYEAAGNVAVLRELVGELDGERLYGPVKTGEPKAEPHVLVVMYGEERDRLARVAKDCAGLGLDERKVRLMEGEIDRLFSAVSLALAVLPAELREVFKVELARTLRNAGQPALRAG